MMSRISFPICVALALALMPGIASARTVARQRVRRAHRKDQGTAARADDPGSRDEEIRMLRSQVEALTGSQQALLNRLQELEGRIGHDAKREGDDIAQVKAQVEKAAEAGKRTVESSQKYLGPGTKPSVKLYGNISAVAAHDSSRMNNIIDPFFVQPRSTPGIAANTDELVIHPRYTRLGVDAGGGQAVGLGRPRTSARLETDFDNAGVSESRQAIRIRHAFGKLDWPEWFVLAGQTWDIIAPLIPSANPGFLMWNTGNVGDRRPQFQLGYEPRRWDPNPHDQFSLVVSGGLSGAVDNVIDNNGLVAGEESGQPMLQARAGWSARKPRTPGRDPLSIGVWGMTGREKFTTPIAGRTNFEQNLGGLDAVIPLAPKFALRGEWWSGNNLADVRGGIGQGISNLGQAVHSHGGWLELTINARGRWNPSAGYGEDAPRLSDLSAVTNRSHNRAWWVTNRFRLGGGLELTLDLTDWKSSFTNNPDEDNTRLEMSAIQNF